MWKVRHRERTCLEGAPGSEPRPGSLEDNAQDIKKSRFATCPTSQTDTNVATPRWRKGQMGLSGTSAPRRPKLRGRGSASGPSFRNAGEVEARPRCSAHHRPGSINPFLRVNSKKFPREGTCSNMVGKFHIIFTYPHLFAPDIVNFSMLNLDIKHDN